MTIILNPFKSLPAPPPPAAPPGPSDRGISTRFGDMLRELHAQHAQPDFLGAAVSQRDGPAQAAAGADIFNEHGLFPGALPSIVAEQTTLMPGPIDQESSAEITLLQEGPPAEPVVLPAPTFSFEPPAGRDLNGADQDRGRSEAGVERAIGRSKAMPATVPHSPGVKTAFAQGRSGAGSDVTVSRRPSLRPRLWAMISRPVERVAAAENPGISIVALEQGGRVVVKLDAVERNDRMRLRDRIAGILSSHGLGGWTIDLKGKVPFREDR